MHPDITKHPDIMALRERYDVASATRSRRSAEGLTLLAAFYLAASPWITGFHTLSAMAVNDLIAGAALTVVTIALSESYGRMHGFTWLVPTMGAWTILAPWVMAGHMDMTRTIWSNCLAGGSIMALGLSLLVIGYLCAGRTTV